MKESPRPPQNFSRMYDRRSHGSCLLPEKSHTGCADTVSAVSGIRLPPECRFRWDCKRRKRFNAGVPGAVAPGKTNLWSPPSRWEGGGGMGERKHTKGRVGGRQRRQAPRRARGLPPCSSAAWVHPRGCKGRSPLHKITLISPFPLGRALCERGSGGWGLGNNLKAGSAGDKESTPPA